jgi:hypothetical protein
MGLLCCCAIRCSGCRRTVTGITAIAWKAAVLVAVPAQRKASATLTDHLPVCLACAWACEGWVALVVLCCLVTKLALRNCKSTPLQGNWCCCCVAAQIPITPDLVYSFGPQAHHLYSLLAGTFYAPVVSWVYTTPGDPYYAWDALTAVCWMEPSLCQVWVDEHMLLLRVMFFCADAGDRGFAAVHRPCLAAHCICMTHTCCCVEWAGKTTSEVVNLPRPLFVDALKADITSRGPAHFAAAFGYFYRSKQTFRWRWCCPALHKAQQS